MLDTAGWMGFILGSEHDYSYAREVFSISTLPMRQSPNALIRIGWPHPTFRVLTWAVSHTWPQPQVEQWDHCPGEGRAALFPPGFLLHWLPRKFTLFPHLTSCLAQSRSSTAVLFLFSHKRLVLWMHGFFLIQRIFRGYLIHFPIWNESRVPPIPTHCVAELTTIGGST